MSSNNVFFSIITVSYNSAKTIARTIESVLNQSFENFEYIIIDGSSKDDTLNIIKKYQGISNGKLSFISEPDNGIYDAMNKGVQKAHGDVIGIVNSDDWLEPDTLSTVASFVKKYGIDDVVYTGNILYHYDDRSVQVIKRTRDDLKHLSKRYDMGVNHPATFVPKIVYDKYGLFDSNLRLQADVDFINRIYGKGVGFVFIDKVLSNMSDGGASTKTYNQPLIDYKYILNKNNVKGFKYYYWFYLYKLRNEIKRRMPKIIIKKHRK